MVSSIVNNALVYRLPWKKPFWSTLYYNTISKHFLQNICFMHCFIQEIQNGDFTRFFVEALWRITVADLLLKTSLCIMNELVSGHMVTCPCAVWRNERKIQNTLDGKPNKLKHSLLHINHFLEFPQDSEDNRHSLACHENRDDCWGAQFFLW